jgi:NitT/TauT family transport system substrate-binding protein
MRAALLVRSAAVLLAAALALGLVVEAAPAPAPALAAQAPLRVRLGVVGGVSDAGFYVGLDKGYYREQGLEIETTPFDTAARMVVPLGAGQLDVGGGTHSVGLFNAVARGVSIKMVADKGSALPGHGFNGLLFRRDLVDSGRLRTPGDLRGLRVANSVAGSVNEALLLAWLRPHGLGLDDIEMVEMGFGDHAAAFNGRTIDAAVSIEPFLTRVVDQGLATLYGRLDEVLPGFQVASVYYSAQFAREQADAARRFMVAYLRAVRYYNDAFGGGDLAKRQDVIGILTRHTTVQDPALYERMAMPGLHPDGTLNVASIANDQEIWLGLGLVQNRVPIQDVVDLSFAEAAVHVLGPYR